jgi:glutathione S-transferase
LLNMATQPPPPRLQQRSDSPLIPHCDFITCGAFCRFPPESQRRDMADYTLCYWPVPFRGQFIRAILAHAGKTWDESDAVAELTKAPPGKQPVPFMGPPVLIDESTGFTLSQMPAIVFYLGETLDLLPEDTPGKAMAIKVVNDANDVIDDITNDGGREMWTAQSWKAYQPRLKRWMAIFEVTARLNNATPDAGFLLGSPQAGVADIVTATLWGTLGDKFSKIGDMLNEEAPLVAGLTRRLMATKPLMDLAAFSQERFGDAYCGGQIEASMRKVINGKTDAK